MLIPVPFAAVDDLEERWRTLTDPEQATAEVLLGDASNLIVSECSSANYVDDADTAEQATRAATLKRITCAMVKRAMIDGGSGDSPSVTEEQNTAGPFGFRLKYSNPTGDLFLTKSERKSLPCGQQRAFNVPLVDYDEPTDDSDLS